MDYDDFARRELPRLLRYAVMLTGDRELAQDLVQDVLVKAHGQWRRVSAADHPDRYVHTMLTRAFLSWRRRWGALGGRVTNGRPVQGRPTHVATGPQTLWIDLLRPGVSIKIVTTSIPLAELYKIAEGIRF